MKDPKQKGVTFLTKKERDEAKQKPEKPSPETSSTPRVRAYVFPRQPRCPGCGNLRTR